MIEISIAKSNVNMTLPVQEGISAGFPSPATDFMGVEIDLNRDLVLHPEATYYGRVSGESMKGAGIDDGDLLVIDKSLEAVHGKIAVCFLDGEFTLKRINIRQDGVWLVPENDKYKPIHCGEENNLIIWGIVTHIIKKV